VKQSNDYIREKMIPHFPEKVSGFGHQMSDRSFWESIGPEIWLDYLLSSFSFRYFYIFDNSLERDNLRAFVIYSG